MFFHYQGEFRGRTFENQGFRGSGLSLVTAAILYWNTTYLDRAVRHLRSQGVVVSDELLAHVAPLGWEHISLTGDDDWTAAATPPGGFFGRLMAVPLVRDAVVRRAGSVKGPNAEARSRQPSFVWGEAENAAGVRRTCRMRTANAYDFTVSASLAVVCSLLDHAPPGGFTTPSRLMGRDFASGLPGSGEMRLT